MTKLTYEIVQHDGGWAYKVDETFSETFPSHESARKAAQHAAEEQAAPGESTRISYEDKQGHWHSENSQGDDRPKPNVKG
jgi:cytochrome c biogenesis protein ResB